MEKARRKLRICLIFVVSLAVLIGCIYYFNDVRSKEKISEGTLVMGDCAGNSTVQTAMYSGLLQAASGREEW